jgi:FkbM family methyltransferase
MHLRNIAAVLKEPALGMEYLAYSASRVMHAGRATRTLPGNIKVTGFSGFGEYHSCANFVGDAEYSFFNNLPLAEGGVVDVGANLGIVTVILARRFADRTVHSIEPNPFTIDALRSNVKLNDCRNAVVHQMAIAGHDGSVKFDANPLNRATTSIANAAAEHQVEVACATMDTFAASRGLDRLAFLKVDVEGYETVVFEGARGVLGRRAISTILFEVAPPMAIRAGFDAARPAQMLEGWGYSLFRLNPDGTVRPATSAQAYDVVLENWVARAP